MNVCRGNLRRIDGRPTVGTGAATSQGAARRFEGTAESTARRRYPTGLTNTGRRRQLGFGHRVALELSLANAWALIGVGVDGVVAAVPGGGQGPVAACAEVVAPLDRCGLAVAEPVGTKLGGHASQE